MQRILYYVGTTIGLAAASILMLSATMGCAGMIEKTPVPTATVSQGTDMPTETARTFHEVSVLFMNVGRADAVLVQVDGLFYLIDTGEEDSVPALYRGLEVLGMDRMEAVFLTHTHKDHIGGMEALAQKYDVGTMYSATFSENNEDGSNDIDVLADELNLPHVKLSAGDSVSLADGISFEVLGPLVYNDDDNDNSMVLRLAVNGRIVLLTGDMQFAEEATLLDAGIDLSADVLKVGNHGNPDATSISFAAAVSPEIAVISTDTLEDSDSANDSVMGALNGATIYVTEDFECGVLLTVGDDGTMDVSDPKPQMAEANIEIADISRNAQTVTLVNHGEDVDLSGYLIFSEKGNEVFLFSDGATIQAGQVITIACCGGTGDYIWDDTKVWDKNDTGVLYDCYGNEISQKKD